MAYRVGVVWDAAFLQHDAGEGHPERADRLIAIREALIEEGMWERFVQIPAREATREELLRCHTAEHVDHVMAAAGRSHVSFDPDTHASLGTIPAALRAVGGSVDLARAVWRREVERGMALVRPPGHHAERDKAMGFCFFGNIALAARALMAEEGAKRVMIVDWDVHHGNGTQHILEDDPRVLFVSLHQYPFYPGTGALEEVGVGQAKGHIVNLPLPMGMNDHDYRLLFQSLILPLAESFEPEMILISAGYDAHRRDPLAMMRLSAGGFAAMADDLCTLAERLCGGRIAAFLEGGYDLEGLSSSVVSTLRVFLGDTVELSGDPQLAGAGSRSILEASKALLAPYSLKS